MAWVPSTQNLGARSMTFVVQRKNAAGGWEAIGTGGKVAPGETVRFFVTGVGELFGVGIGDAPHFVVTKGGIEELNDRATPNIKGEARYDWTPQVSGVYSVTVDIYGGFFGRQSQNATFEVSTSAPSPPGTKPIPIALLIGLGVAGLAGVVVLWTIFKKK